MELWDILDENGNKTGRTVERNEKHTMKENEYMLAVHIYIHDSKNQWLIQKRAETKEILPNIWDITGGAVTSGEDSITAAMRETKEEIGINLDKCKMYVTERLKRKHSYVDIWVATADFELSECVLQPEEVAEVKWVSAGELIKMVFEAEYRDDNYKAVVQEFTK
jgi:8-oxo-dGTP diphosphatase